MADKTRLTFAEARALLLAERPDDELWRLCVEAALIAALTEKLRKLNEERGEAK